MKTVSGKFVLRIGAEFHAELSNLAKERGLSLNQLCCDLIRRGMSVNAETNTDQRPFDAIINRLKTKFKGQLEGVLLFGSYVRGEAADHSDIDMLIVLQRGSPIVRSLYRWWDSEIEWGGDLELNPHFVVIPDDPNDVSGLWLEVVELSKIIYAKDNNLKSKLREIKTNIEKGRVRRCVSNGHPFWVWREDEK